MGLRGVAHKQATEPGLRPPDSAQRGVASLSLTGDREASTRQATGGLRGTPLRRAAPPVDALALLTEATQNAARVATTIRGASVRPPSCLQPLRRSGPIFGLSPARANAVTPSQTAVGHASHTAGSRIVERRALRPQLRQSHRWAPGAHAVLSLRPTRSERPAASTRT